MKTYEERVSDNPGRGGASKHEKSTDAPGGGGLRHHKVCGADAPVPSAERNGDVHIGIASYGVISGHERKHGRMMGWAHDMCNSLRSSQSQARNLGCWHRFPR